MYTKIEEVRSVLTPEEQTLFALREHDTPEDTLLALVLEVMRLRERVQALENPRS